MRKPPSAWSVVWTDNTCCQVVSIAVVVLFFGGMVALTGTLPAGRGKPEIPLEPEVAGRIVTSALAGVLLLAGIVAWRVTRIRALIERGLELEATVRKVKRIRGGEKLKLELQHAGVSYRVCSTFQRGSRTPRFEAGSRIPVLVDPLDPGRAVPLALYVDPDAAPAEVSS